jgi:hypothetical protein
MLSRLQLLLIIEYLVYVKSGGIILILFISVENIYNYSLTKIKGFIIYLN